MSAVGATEAANVHANAQTSPHLSPDNGTGYAPHWPVDEARTATSTNAYVATASLATEELQINQE